MTANLASIYNYADLRGLAELRAHARHDPAEAAEATARQFEALFIQMMLKGMRDAMPADGGLEGGGVRFYREMFDQQIALELSRGEGIGLREPLMRQLSASRDVSPDILDMVVLHMPERRWMPPVAAVGTGLNGLAAAQQPSGAGPAAPGMRDSLPGAAGAVAAGSREGYAAAADGEPLPWPPASAEAFVRGLWPYAAKAAAELGVRPEVLLAQAALETGWGRHVIPRADGSSSFNLFGIKADTRWEGERAHVRTLEYVNGVPERQQAAFRAYDSPAESFEDYVRFLQRNPRYRDALSRAPDAEAFLRGLQAAGYATDPAYADKILRILERSPIPGIVELKFAGSRPIS